MRGFLLSVAIAASGVIAAPALAATFINVGDSATIAFVGSDPGTSASLALVLASEDEANGVFSFSYTMTNTSDSGLNPDVVVNSFGFNDIGVATNVGSAATMDDNGYNAVAFNTTFPEGLGSRDVCIFGTPGNCTNIPGPGATVGNPATGSFTLDYAGSLTQLELDNFAVVFQGTGFDGEDFATGVPAAVAVIPEPGTWAMMIVGFGLVGGLLRRARLQPRGQPLLAG